MFRRLRASGSGFQGFRVYGSGLGLQAFRILGVLGSLGFKGLEFQGFRASKVWAFRVACRAFNLLGFTALGCFTGPGF